MIISTRICVAVDKTGGFAKDNQIPWFIPEDFKHFMNTTSGSWCITGKNSYLEMVEMKKRKLGDKYNPDAPVLANRVTFVVSSTLESDGFNDCVIVRPHELDPLIHSLHSFDEERHLDILGGQQLFEELIDRVDTVIMTVIPDDYHCDRFFPISKLVEFKKESSSVLETEKYGNSVIVDTFSR